MNYEAEFGTDWESVDREEALRRAYALGVAAHLGDDHPEEFERVRAAAETAYDRELIDLAYEEGESKAATARAQGADTDADIWEAVRPEAETGGGESPEAGSESEQTATESGPPPGPTGADRDRTALPSSVADNGLPDGSPDRLDLPSFLRR